MDRRACNGPPYLPLRVMKKAAKFFLKYGTMEAMTARRDHYAPSRGPSTQTCLDRFLVIRILLLLGFCFYYK